MCLYSLLKGTLLLVSHDREFIDNVVSGSLFFEGNGSISQFVGGYADVHDWYSSKAKQSSKDEPASITKKSSKEKPVATQTKVKKLSYKEQRELDELPKVLETLENELEALQEIVSKADFYSQEMTKTQPVLDELQQKEQKLEETFIRWEELETLKNKP